MAVVQRTDTSNTAAPVTATNNYGKPMKPADGWLNIKVKTAAGDWITVPCRIALDAAKPVHLGLLNKFKEDPTFVFEMQGVIGGAEEKTVPVF